MVNLDPAAEYFDYPVEIGNQRKEIFVDVFRTYVTCFPLDISELIRVDDVMEDEDLKLGPNGGLVFCME